MKHRFYAPLSLTLATIVAFVGLISLGTWQVQRLQWKNDLIERIETNMSGQPVALPASIDDVASWEYRRVEITGTYTQAPNVCVLGRSLRGEPGLLLFQPMRLTGDRVLFVNLGWISRADTIAIAKEIGETSTGWTCPVLDGGAVTDTITGVLRVPSKGNSFTPEPNLETRIWSNTAITDMAKWYGFEDVHPMYLTADDTASLPLGGQTRVTIENRHFGYILTWYGLALALVGVYIAYGLYAPLPKPGENS